MAWRDKLRPASFRGVPFKVATSERGGGRRTVDHEYPFQDEAYVEDLGRRYRTFSLEAHVVGADYASARDALLTALEAAGVGQLVHPFYGTRIVAVDSYRVRDNLTDEGRLARFSITFKESLATPVFPVATADPSDLVGTAVDGALGPIENFFNGLFSTDGMPQYVLDSASGILKDATAVMDQVLSPVVAATAAAATLKTQLDHLVLDADALVREPFKIIGRLYDVLKTLKTAPALPSRKLPALLKAYGFQTSAAPSETTSTRRQEATNRLALIGAVQQLTLVEAARQAPDIAYESHEEAITTRDEILAKLDEQTETVTDDAVFAALTTLRAKVVLAVPAPTQRLARLQTYTPAVTQPSVVLAYDLYGHLRHEQDLVTRNHVRYPGFVPAARPLQVLTDE